MNQNDSQIQEAYKWVFGCRGFKSLLDLVSNTTNDSFELYYGLFMYNQASQ